MNIFITGGASGLGLAITKKLAEDAKNNLLVTYNNADETAKELEKLPNVSCLKCNFAVAEDIEQAKSKLKEFDVDVLINNAYSGITNQHFHKIPAEHFVNAFRTNLFPVIALAQEALLLFKKKKFGKIITITTAYLINKPPLGLSEYVASKAYLESLSKSWATEYAKFNITSNCISPSMMETNLTSDIDDRIIDMMKEQTPLKKLLDPSEVADVVSFFVNASQQINGTNFIINQGTEIA